VRHGGEEGGDGVERREAVVKLDREPADGRAVDVAHLCRELAREEEEVAERLKCELRVVRSWAARTKERCETERCFTGRLGSEPWRRLTLYAHDHVVHYRWMRLEEPLCVLVRVERPASAQVEGGKLTVIQQGYDVGGIADEMGQMKDLRIRSLDTYVHDSVDEN